MAIEGIIFSIRFPNAAPFHPGAERIYNERHKHTIAPDNQYYKAILPWTRRMAALLVNEGITQNLTSDILSTCKTTGQVARAWPELIKFMPEEIQERLTGATRASRLPAGFNVLEINDKRKIATEHLAFMSLMKDIPDDNIRVRVP